MNRLSNLQGLITGAAGDIGRVTARHCLAEGASLILLDRDGGALNDTLADLRNEFPHAGLAVGTVDVRDGKAVQDALASTVQAPLDFVFANAGVEGPVDDISDYEDAAFGNVLQINCGGVFHTVKYAHEFARDGASFLITSSVVGLKGSPRTIGYVTSKHAVVGLMRSAAKAFAARGIRVNCIHPGIVESDMLRRIEGGLVALGEASPRERFLAATPMNLPVSPDDVARAAIFFFSSESRLVTGQTLAVDGGYLL